MRLSWTSALCLLAFPSPSSVKSLAALSSFGGQPSGMSGHDIPEELTPALGLGMWLRVSQLLATLLCLTMMHLGPIKCLLAQLRIILFPAGLLRAKDAWLVYISPPVAESLDEESELRRKQRSTKVRVQVYVLEFGLLGPTTLKSYPSKFHLR